MPYYSRHSRQHQLSNDIAYHVINRANARAKIFHDHEDYDMFKCILLKYSRKNEVSIYHYCIMCNHYHLLIEIEEPERLSAFMANVNRLYTVYYHKRYKTSGHLWQGRFKSKAVQKDGYLLGCGRYIEMNPVTCGIVSHPEDYLYSSARYYVLGSVDNLVTEDSLYAGFGTDSQTRQEGYRKFLLNFDAEKEKRYTKYDLEVLRIFRMKIGTPIFNDKAGNKLTMSLNEGTHKYAYDRTYQLVRLGQIKNYITSTK